MKTIKLKGVLAVIALVVSLSSCRHKELYDEEINYQDVEVVFDWRNAPDANPASMVLYLYEQKGGTPLRYVFSGRDGGKIRLPYGTYNSITMNGDDTDWAYDNNINDIDNFTTVTHEVHPSIASSTYSAHVSRADESKIVENPKMLWSDRVDGFTLSSADYNTRKVLTLYPEEAVCHYTVTVLDVENIDSVSGTKIEGILSGLAEGFKHGQQTNGGESVIMPLELNVDVADDKLSGQFLTFGEETHEQHKDILSLYLNLADGSRWYSDFDVTDQVHNAKDPHHVDIVIRGIKLPVGEGSPGGFTADVSPWQRVDIYLPM